MLVRIQRAAKRAEHLGRLDPSAHPTAHAQEQSGHHGLRRNLLGWNAVGEGTSPTGPHSVKRRVVKAAACHKHTPTIVLINYKGEESSHQRTKPADGFARSPEPMTYPCIHSSDDPNLYGIDQPPSVTEVRVDQWPRHAGGRGYLLEGGEERVMFGQQPFGGVDNQASPGLRIKPGGPGARWRTGGRTGSRSGQADAPARSTSATDSPGDKG